MKQKPLKKKEESTPAPQVQEYIFQPVLKLALLAALFGALLYANSIVNYYVLDDKGVILANEYVHQGFKGIGGVLSSEVWHSQNVNLGYYRPLSLITFAIENQFLPGNNAHVSHAINILLFALTGFFLCLLLMRVFRNYNPLFAFVAAMLFMAHPIHTEVVANIKSRDEILAFLNMVLAIYLLIPGNDDKLPVWRYITSGLFFYLALLSKETALVGIVLLPLFLFYERKSNFKTLALVTAPFLLALLVFQIQKYMVLGNVGTMVGSDIINYPYAESGSKLASMFLIFAWCIKLALVPYPLSYSYAYNQIPAAEWSSVGAIAGLLLAAALTFIAVRKFRDKGIVSLGVLIFLIALAPALAFVLLRGGILAERFLYAPVLGLCLLLAYGAFKLAGVSLKEKELTLRGAFKNAKLSIPLLLVLLGYSFVTINRNTNWQNDISLTAHDVKVTPNSCQVHLHYGIQLTEEALTTKKPETFSEGLKELNTALQINPHIPEAYCEIGRAYEFIAANNDSAIFYYNRSIMENSGFALGYFSLGQLYERTGKQELASYYYNKGVSVNPNSLEGVAALERHKKQTGLDVKEFPSSANVNAVEETGGVKDFDYYSNLGQDYGKKGDYVNALRCLSKAVELKPDNEEASINLSLCLAMTKQYDKSIEVLNRVVKMNPNNTLAWNNLAIIYDHVGNKAKADECKKRTAQLNAQ